MSRVSASDVLLAMSGSYRSEESIVAGGDGGGGGGRRHGGGGRRRHHGRRGGGFRGLGGGWGYFDREPGVVIVDSKRDCQHGLYAPSGNLVCPGDPGYEELLRSVRSPQSTGASPRPPLVAVGAVERRNPLPPGRYWVDVFWSKRGAFTAWLSKNAASIKVVNVESYPGDMDAGYEAREWYLFQVLSPVAWEGPGLPTVAGSGVTTSDDTVQKPPPESPGDYLPKLPSAEKLGFTAAAVGLGLFALVMFLRK